MVSVKSSRVLSSWPGWLSSAVLIAALTAAARPRRASAAAGVRSASAPAATAIVNARIIDGSGNAPFEGTVVLKGDRIAEVGRSVKPPEGARVIDAQGGTVMPGLVDLVVELPRGAANDLLTRAAAASLYSGVTTIVPNGLSAADIDALRDRLLRAGIKSPRLAMPAAPDRLVRGGASGGSLADAQAFSEWKQNNATYVPVLAAAAPADSRKPTALLGEVSGGAAPALARAQVPGPAPSSGAATAATAARAGTGSAAARPADPGRWKMLLDQTRTRARRRHPPRSRLRRRRAGPAVRLVLAAGRAPFRGRRPHAASGGHRRDERRRLGAGRPVRPGLPRRRPARRSPRRQRRPVILDQRHREDRARHLRWRSGRSRGAARADRGFARRTGRHRVHHRQRSRREDVAPDAARRSPRTRARRTRRRARRGVVDPKGARREAHRPRTRRRTRQARRGARAGVA